MESNGCSKINKFVSKIFFLNLEISCLKVPTPMQFTAVNFDEKFYLDGVFVSDQKKLFISPLIIHSRICDSACIREESLATNLPPDRLSINAYSVE